MSKLGIDDMDIAARSSDCCRRECAKCNHQRVGDENFQGSLGDVGYNKFKKGVVLSAIFI